MNSTNDVTEDNSFERDVMNAVTRLSLGEEVSDPTIRACARIMMRTPDLSQLSQTYPATPKSKRTKLPNVLTL